MKKNLFLTAIGLLVLFNVSAQDVIIKTNGDDIKAKVTEISQSEIKYKMFDNPEGPVFILKREEVFMIKYENGTKDLFTTTAVKEKSSPVSHSSGAQEKAFMPALYAGPSWPMGFFGSEPDEDEIFDGRAAKSGFCIGHQGLINLNGEPVFITYDLSFNLSPYRFTFFLGYPVPYPPYNYYEFFTAKGNYINNLALVGFRYMQMENTSPIYFGMGTGINLPVLTGYLKDEAEFKVSQGVAFKVNMGVLVKKHFDISLSYLYTRPKLKFDVPIFNYGFYEYNIEQKVSMLQYTLGYTF